MKKLIYAFTALIISTNLMAQGIEFEHGQLKDALAKAKEENKLVFVDVYTTWCGPCKQMVKNIFPLHEVGTYYNKNFVCYKLDAEDAKVKGPDYAQKYKVNGFPTYLFLNGEGELVYSTGGAMDADMFIKVGKKALGEDVDDGFDEVLARYQNGDYSDTTIFLLMTKFVEKSALGGSREEMMKYQNLYSEAAARFFSGDARKFLNPEYFAYLKQMYQYQGITREHEIVKYMLNNYDEFNNKLDENEFATFLMFVNYTSIQNAAREVNKEKYQEYLKDINGCLKRAYAFNDESKIPAKKFLTAMGDSEYALSQNDYDTYIDKYEEFISYKKGQLGAIEYLMPARRLLGAKKAPTQEQLERCIPFNQIAYDKYKNAYVCTDFGKLMAKLGNPDKAKEYYSEAFEMFKSQGERGQMMIERFKKEMTELGLL